MRTIRPAFALILTTAAVLAVAPSPARADFDYTYALSGTITEVADLSAITMGGVPTSEHVHLLPGLSVGDPITASGQLTVNPDGSFYDATLTVAAPADFRFTIEHTFTTASRFLDPAQPDLGFLLEFQGLVQSEHPAIIPNRFAWDFVTRTTIFGPSLNATVHHNSFMLYPLDATVRASFSTLTITPVPEPASLALLLIGVTGVGLAARRTLAARPGS